MIRELLSAALCLAVCAAAALPSRAGTAEVPCAPRAEILERLGDRYGETRHSIGMADNGFVVETFAAESGSWTILVTRPNGISCLMASGKWFEATREVLPAGDPA